MMGFHRLALPLKTSRSSASSIVPGAEKKLRSYFNDDEKFRKGMNMELNIYSSNLGASQTTLVSDKKGICT